MSLGAVTTLAANGLAANQARLENSAQRVASATTVTPVQSSASSEDASRQQRALAERQQGDKMVQDMRAEQSVIEQKLALYNFQANLRSIRTADTVLGSLLDVSA
jgi:hypothetical protein